MSGGNTATDENALREGCEHKVMTQHGKGMRDMAPYLVVGCNISGELAGPRCDRRAARQTFDAIAVIDAGASQQIAWQFRYALMARLAMPRTAQYLPAANRADADPRANRYIRPAFNVLGSTPKPLCQRGAIDVSVNRYRATAR